MSLLGALKLRAVPKPEQRLLVYDVETYATGFADPNWVPQVVTCIAWKWLDDPHSPRVDTSLDWRNPRSPMHHLDPEAIREMLVNFLADYRTADAVVTYNGAGFDQPILNAMMWYTGQAPLPPTMVYDLHRFGSVKGMKKGLDNVAIALGVTKHKQAMNHAQWQAAYLEPGWETIKSRAVSDVLLTEAVYHAVKAKGWLRPAEGWFP